ncbi:MAG: M3 family metallopeptidase [Gammaproteobacteria bacterium]|nr:M3 family metallopeptidase [Gammaproteobacteria bacterium]
MKHFLGLIMASGLVLAGCEQATQEPGSEATEADSEIAADEVAIAGNPLLAEWDTPFGVPPFDLIEDEHYLPAMREGIKRTLAEIDQITANSDAATFANTLEALETAGGDLSRVSRVFFAVNSAHSNDSTRETAKVIAPELSAMRDAIFLNEDLFARVNAIYEQRESLDLSAEQMRLLSESHKGFIRSGANLDEKSKERLKEINSELASSSQQFGENLLDETNEFELLVSDRGDLGKLPSNLVALAAEEAKRRGHDCECWAFTLQRPSINPFLEYSPNRELRKQIYMGYAMRGDNDNAADNKEILARMVALRAERAQLMGYESHAHFVLSDNMAETPERVYALLDQVWKPAIALAGKERAALQEMMDADGIDDRVRGWDWRHYTEKVRKARYELDQQALRPYFEVTAVRDGAFAVATKLFGLTFEARDDLPTWHPDQEAFEVFDADGSHLAILYMDWFARESKRGGAWMNALRSQQKFGGDVSPIITNNFNFPAPIGDTPSLISYGDASTTFHEFGHALNGMLSDVTYESLSGTSTPRDFVEFPSQVMENWMGEPEVLRMFARHYETGEPIPQEFIDKIVASAKFNQGFATVEYMAASYLDLTYHTLSHPVEIGDPREFEIAAMEAIGLIEEIIPRYRSGYFAHIFSGGYSSGYYGYMWSEVLDADAFQAFKETSLFDPEMAAKFRKHILAKGGSEPGMDLYVAFRGREPSIEPLLERRGMTDSE